MRLGPQVTTIHLFGVQDESLLDYEVPEMSSELLDKVREAHGGMDRWNHLQRCRRPLSPAVSYLV